MFRATHDNRFPSGNKFTRIFLVLEGVPQLRSKIDRFLTAGDLLFNLNLRETSEPGLDTSDFEAHSSYVGAENSFKFARFVVSMSL